MLTTAVTTSYRRRQRRLARIPVATVRDRQPVRIVAPPLTDRLPAAVWADPDTLHSDLDLATWEDAEWR